MIPNGTDWTIVTSAVVKALQLILAALVLTSVIDLTGEQLAGIVLAVEAVLGIPLAYLAARRTLPVGPAAPLVPPAVPGG